VRAGVQTSIHYPPIHRLSIHRRPDVTLPSTEEYAARTVTLPLFAHMTEQQQDLVVDGVTDHARGGCLG
jgi:dTDP-4-amino-4,6-dideoxygalactose transaminase